MKRILVLILTLSLLLSAVACGSDPGMESTQPVSESTTPAQTEPAKTKPAETEPNGTTPPSTTPVATEPPATTPEDTGAPPIPTEDTVYMFSYESFDWRIFFSTHAPINVKSSNESAVQVSASGYLSEDEVAILLTAGEEGYSRITAGAGDELSILHVYVEKPPVPDPPAPPEITDPEALESHLESVVYLQAYEVYDWTPLFADEGELQMAEDTKDVICTLGAFLATTDSGARRAQVVIQANALSGYVMLTATVGGQTRVLHVHVEGEDPGPTGEEPVPDPEPVQTDFVYPDINIGPVEQDSFYFPAVVSGPCTVTLSNEGIIKLEDEGKWYGLTFQILFRGRKPGSTEMTVQIGDYTYRTTINVTVDPTVLMTEGDLCHAITVDNADATVYMDDTTVTFTVTTDPSVDRLTFEHIARESNVIYSYDNLQDVLRDAPEVIFALETLTVDGSNLTDRLVDGAHGTRYSAKRELVDGKLVWTVQWDQGYTAVEYIRVTATDTDTGDSHVNFAHLNIVYPTFDPSQGLEPIVLFWLKLNINEPLFFLVDEDKMTDRQRELKETYESSLAIFEDEVSWILGRGWGDTGMTTREFYDYKMDGSPLYGSNTVEVLSPAAFVNCLMYNSPDNPEKYEVLRGKNRLTTSYYVEGATYMLFDEFSAEIRAVMAYLYDYEIDENVFPYAHSILERGREALEEILKPGMTDFEKEHAIYTWMIANHNKGYRQPSEVAPQDFYYYVKTAYGLLNGYGGDCMAWSGTFFTLCSMAGLDCMTFDVQGDAGGHTDDPEFQPNHRINVIRLEDEYYFVEVFWFYQYDPVTNNRGDYYYLNLTSERAAEYYTWYEDIMPMTDTSYLTDPYTGQLLNP